jgi:hypothetical protein
MSALAIVLIALGGLLLILLLGGYLVARRRRERHDYAEAVRTADRGLEHARAADRGWDRALLERVCVDALRSQRPDLEYDAIDLVLVDDRPGVAEDRAHMVARGKRGHTRLVLVRGQGGDWSVSSIE